MNYAGLFVKKRKLLAKLLAEAKGVITIDMAADILHMERERARSLLSSLHRSGWLKMVQGGMYVPVPLEAEDPSLTGENPFVLASYLYKNCYMGGWSAASYWGLTDQIFLKNWVMTTQNVKRKEVERGGHSFVLTHIKEDYFYGLHTQWIERDQIYISDLHKTLIDFANFMDYFSLISLEDTFKEYLQSKDKDLEKLIDYAQKAHNRTLFKRLGFLLEVYAPTETEAIDTCAQNISSGPSKLSTSTRCSVYLKKWRMYVPERMIKYD
jgi:predicted transcriptional regulator of viral defense system